MKVEKQLQFRMTVHSVIHCTYYVSITILGVEKRDKEEQESLYPLRNLSHS